MKKHLELKPRHASFVRKKFEMPKPATTSTMETISQFSDEESSSSPAQQSNKRPGDMLGLENEQVSKKRRTNLAQHLSKKKESQESNGSGDEIVAPRYHRFHVISCAKQSNMLVVHVAEPNVRIHVCRPWDVDIKIEQHTIVHVVDAKESNDQGITIFVVDEKQGYFIVNPDHLVTATNVADSVKCIRYAYFNNMRIV